MSVIILDHASLDDKHQAPVRNFSYNFWENRVYALLGTADSGLESLYDLLSGRKAPDSGHVWLDGYPLSNPKAESRVCYLAPDSAFLPFQPVYSILKAMEKKYPKWDRALSGAFVDHFHLPLNDAYGTLSARDRSLLLAGVALASCANVTLVNASLASVDPKDRHDFFSMLYEHHERYPRCFIISTTFIDDLSDIVDQVLMLYKGRLMEVFTPEEIENGFTYLSGKPEVLKGLVQNMRMISYEERHGVLSVCVPVRLNKDEIRKFQKYLIKMSTVPIEKVFIYLSALRERKDAAEFMHDD